MQLVLSERHSRVSTRDKIVGAGAVLAAFFVGFALLSSTSGRAGSSSGTVSLSNGRVTALQVQTDGCWTGAIMVVADGSTTQTVEGCSDKSFRTPGAKLVSVSFQKKSAGASELRVTLLSNGEPIARESTTAAYGVVSLAR